MAATTIRELLVRLGVSDADTSAKAVEKLDGAMESLLNVATAVVGAIVAASAALGGLAVSAASAGDAIDKGAKGAAISTSAYQELAFMASQSGTSIETVSKALSKQAQGLQQLREQTGPINDALTDLHLRYTDLAGLPLDQQFRATANALSQLTSDQERLRLATAIYGEDMAQQLLPLLSTGTVAWGEMADEAHRLGLVISEEDVAASVLFTDTLDQLWRILTAIKNSVGLALIPTLTRLGKKLKEWYADNAKIIAQRIDEWTDRVIGGIEKLERWIIRLDEAVTRTFGGWGPLLAAAGAAMSALASTFVLMGGAKIIMAIQALGEFVALIGGGTIAAGLVVLGKALVIVAALAAAAIALYLAFDDLMVYLRGGDSVLGRLAARFEGLRSYLEAGAKVAGVLGAIFGRLIGIVEQLGAIWWAVFQQTSLPVLRAVGDALLWLAEQGLGAVAWWAETVVLPALEKVLQFLGWVSGGVGAIGSTLGVELGGGGTAGAPGATTGAPGLTTAPTPSPSSLAPLTAAFAPVPVVSGAAGGAGRSITIQGSTWSFSGVGISREEAQRLIDDNIAREQRQIAAALDGAEV